MRILIADDDPIQRRLLEIALTKWEYEVVIAREGKEAWQILQGEDAPKIAILDWLMPGMDGVEVSRRVRLRTDAPYVYIILLTSKDRKEDIVEGMEAGADDYLIKPFETHRLQVRLRAGRRIIDLQTELLASLEELAQARHREVEIGARIQQTLLLGQSPQDIPGLQVAALTLPSQQIDGDFYDFFRHNDRCLDVIVGDVMGKGVPAALFGAAIKSHFLRALSRLLSAAGRGDLPEPEEIVTAVHGEVTGQFIGLDSFATLCYTRFDREQRRATFVDCGHTKTIHFQQRTGRCETLQGESMPLGISEREVYAQVSRPFEAGDLFFFYSDGVTEARNAAGEFFGFDRLEETIRANSTLTPAEIIDSVRRAVVVFSHAETFRDDLTCVAVKIAALEAEGRRQEAEAYPEPCHERREGNSRLEDPLRLAHAELEVSSALTGLPTIRAFLRGFCRDRVSPALQEDSLGQLELAVNEAASNIMRHAYHGRADRRIQIEADAFADRVAVRLLHTGDPFEPEATPPPAFDGSREGGFGVYLIAQSVDQVRYSRDEQGRNCTLLVKKRTSLTPGPSP
jgi:sigma-B regulation protein RsbU (phosphoserine phosphatase)